MARLLRYAWPTLAIAWLVAFATAGGGPGVGSVMLPAAILLAAAALISWSIVDTPRHRAMGRRSWATARARPVLVPRSTDPDAAGRPHPRAPGF
jgi:hypothetical protein